MSRPARSNPPSSRAPGLKSRLAERLCEALRIEIASGRWKDCLPGERELSRQFQVSRPTLRVALWALDHEGLVKVRAGQPSQILRVPGVVRPAPGRRPDVLLVRDARMKPDLTSQLLWSDLARDRFHDLGLGLHSVDALAHGSKALPKTLAEIDARYSPSYYVLWSLPPAAHWWFAQKNLPAVIIGSPAAGVQFPAIDVDYEATIRHAVHHLVRHGHRRLALLNIPASTVGAVKLDENFLGCCNEPGENVQGTVMHTNLRPDQVEAMVRRMMRGAQPPTAIIPTDLELLIGAYTTLGSLGLNVPRDVSVICTNHWKIQDFIRPVPTAYQISWEKLADRVARIIRDHQQLGAWPHQFWKLMPTFREGGSVATLRR